ncbi:MAG: hypothetical protein QW083_04740 [Methanomassiliicoccales archaeon]
MWVSGCGYACEICAYRKNGKCLGCSPDNKQASLCILYSCFESKGYDTCLQCDKRLECGRYSLALKQCPVRRSLVGYW